MIGVIASIKVKPGMGPQFEAVARQLVAKVNANEPGCKLYQLYRGETADSYVFLERYVDEEAMTAHRRSEHFRTLGAQMGPFMDGRAEVRRLAEVE